MNHKCQKPVHHHSEIPVSKSEGNLEETLFATCLETAENKYTSEVYEILNQVGPILKTSNQQN